MTAKKRLFNAVPELNGVYLARSGKLWCTAIRLSDDSLCLYSPLPDVCDKHIASLRKLGDVSMLLAPNHYHTRGLTDHVRWFPNADLVCTAAAKPRLEKQTGLTFQGMDGLIQRLPAQRQILEPAGLKTGEVWIDIDAPGSTRAWMVCDAFSATPLKSNVDEGTPSLLATFPKYGVREGAIYQSWVQEQLAARSPTLLIPCHGPPARGAGLGTSLAALLDAF